MKPFSFILTYTLHSLCTYFFILFWYISCQTILIRFLSLSLAHSFLCQCCFCVLISRQGVSQETLFFFLPFIWLHIVCLIFFLYFSSNSTFLIFFFLLRIEFEIEKTIAFSIRFSSLLLLMSREVNVMILMKRQIETERRERKSFSFYEVKWNIYLSISTSLYWNHFFFLLPFDLNILEWLCSLDEVNYF